MATRLLIVEDDALLRSTLAASLDDGLTIVVAACGSAREAIRIAETEPFDVLVADLDLGGGPNGIVLAQTLRRDNLRIGVVLLTSYAEPRLISPKLDRLPPGAPYVLKQDVRDLEHLHAAIERARTPQDLAPPDLGRLRHRRPRRARARGRAARLGQPRRRVRGGHARVVRRRARPAPPARRGARGRALVRARIPPVRR